ncbi:hypothetical protein Trydic_g23984 [Trypoxylus dichotomus]
MDQANPKLADGQKFSSEDKELLFVSQTSQPRPAPRIPAITGALQHLCSENKEKREAPGSGIGQQTPHRTPSWLRSRGSGNYFQYLTLQENSGLSLKARMTVLKTIALPMALYGQEIWVKGSPKAIKTMQKTQLILARKCSGAPWFTRNSELTKELRLEDVEKTALERRQQVITSMKNHPIKSVRCRATKLE